MLPTFEKFGGGRAIVKKCGKFRVESGTTFDVIQCGPQAQGRRKEAGKDCPRPPNLRGATKGYEVFTTMLLMLLL